MTAENNETLLEIDRMLTELNKEMSEADKHALVNDAELSAVVAQNKTFRSVFTKLKPIFELGGGGGDFGTLLPKIMPAVQALQTDEELKTDLAAILEIVK